MAKIKHLEVASCKLHMPWFWMNVLSFPLTSLVWLECSSKLVRYIIALCIGIYVVFLQFCYAKLRRLRLNCNCTVTDSETIWRKQLLCCFHTLGSNLFAILIANRFSSDRVVWQLWVAMMSCVGCLPKDSELFILTFIHLVALNLLVNNQLNSLSNATHHCGT